MAQGSWLATRGPIFKFVGGFIVLVAVFQVLFLTVITPSAAFRAYMALNADLSAWILTLFGEDARAIDNNLYGPGVALSLERGCDGIQPAGIFVAAVLAFPATLRSRLIGIASGVTVLLGLNLVRVVSLYYISRELPDVFHTSHETIWPTGFIFLALAFWMVWVLVGTPKPGDAQPQ